MKEQISDQNSAAKWWSRISKQTKEKGNKLLITHLLNKWTKVDKNIAHTLQMKHKNSRKKEKKRDKEKKVKNREKGELQEL